MDHGLLCSQFGKGNVIALFDVLLHETLYSLEKLLVSLHRESTPDYPR